MKIALIATVFNEAGNLSRWWDCLMQQTRLPDEIVIVDGGSTDGTWEQLQKLATTCRVPVKLDQRRCNIAGGRNRAIALAAGEIIAATDAGSFPGKEWLEEITRPLCENPAIDVTGGLNVCTPVTDFHRYIVQFEGNEQSGVSGGEIHPSSRNTAFRRQVWADVGGYPEWLTLAAEDSLFTYQLNKLGKNFHYNPKARVNWSIRDTEAAYFKLLYRNAYGGAEAQLYWPYFRQRAIIALFPPLLFFSRHRFRHLRFRYLKNFYSTYGWLNGKLRGHRPPKGWQQMGGVLLSPEAQNYLGQKS